MAPPIFSSLATGGYHQLRGVYTSLVYFASSRADSLFSSAWLLLVMRAVGLNGPPTVLDSTETLIKPFKQTANVQNLLHPGCPLELPVDKRSLATAWYSHFILDNYYYHERLFCIVN
ncbi:hypothetical protein [uncultured Thiobacillus sp.]|uniref:hypothetical protein n=1 Tax=uncultured Thiobacillus sp. TaxID=189996 RepID=UPI0026266BFF|nr:hypothetical protein [uncultured Thiobacillus sp.]